MADEKRVTIKTGSGEGTEEQGQYVDLTDTVKIYATDKAPYHKEGEEINTHPKMAENFISKGFATEKKKAFKD